MKLIEGFGGLISISSILVFFGVPSWNTITTYLKKWLSKIFGTEIVTEPVVAPIPKE